MNTISLCMIVRNEESNIERCLKSINGLVDEIIIVDTGSSDRTKELCSAFGAKVYDFHWEDDFSKARNFSIEKATSDWILWLDADEELIIRKKELKELLLQKEASMYLIKMLHLYGEEPNPKSNYYISYHHRLFQKKDSISFQGTIHERLVSIKMNDTSEVCDFFEILHYGYLKEAASKKTLRNLELLMKEKKAGNEDPWIDYHIAAELYRSHDAQHAYLMVNQAIAKFLMEETLPSALVYKLKYDILVRTSKMEEAKKGIEKVIELYPDYVELHFYKGIILYRLEEYEEARKAFSRCLILGEKNSNYLIKLGSGSFYAYYYIGECYRNMNHPEHAKIAYDQAVECNPQVKLLLNVH